MTLRSFRQQIGFALVTIGLTLGTPDQGHALGGNLSQDTNEFVPNTDCRWIISANQFSVNGADAAVQLTNAFASTGSFFQSYAGGSDFSNDAIRNFPAITPANLATCGYVDPVIISQNGADGTFATDDYIGIIFHARTTAGGPLYRYEYAASGVTATTAIFTRTLVDTTAPTTTLSTTATQVSAGDNVVVNITFSEAVTGLLGSELSLTNATLVSLTGSGTAWVATLSATGGGDVSVTVPADVADDAAGNGNLASEPLTIGRAGLQQAQAQISQFMQSRANLLLQNQPALSPFLSGAGTGRFDGQVTQGFGAFNFASNPDAPFWMTLNGAWSNESARELRYFFGAVGGHAEVSPNLLVGGMLQFDHLDQEDGAARTDGTGWLAGPYFVARLPEQNLIFDGRLLYGQSSNSISPIGTYTDKYDSDRLLASVQMSGVLEYGQTDIIPSLKASYTRDTQSAYRDTPGNLLPEQSVELGQVQAGLGFATPMPLYDGAGEMTLTGGFSAIGSFVNGSGATLPEYEGGRARIDLGLMHNMANGARFGLQSYYDGIGASGYESYGLSVNLEFAF